MAIFLSKAARAFGTGIGALFLAFFGAAWIFCSLYFLGSHQIGLYAASALVTAALVWRAILVIRRNAAAGRSQIDPAYRTHMRKVFAIVNVIQWTLVFICAYELGNHGLDWLIVPAIVLIVGVHFFPLARLFDLKLYYATGAFLAGWAIAASFVLPKSAVPNDTAIGTGLLLWLTAIILLLPARKSESHSGDVVPR